MTSYKIKTSLCLFSIIGISLTMGLNDSFAQEETTYKVADGIQTVLTFTFKDGVEVIEFPIFNMNDDYINKNVSPSFSVEGVVGEFPHLHKALDEAFKYKGNRSYEHNYQLFDVDVAFIKNNEAIRTLSYHDCMVDDYKVITLNDSYESYTSSSSGFAIIDDIEFQCGGLDSLSKTTKSTWRPEFTTTEYEPTSYKFAGDVRSFVTFEFDKGVEKLEFPVFIIESGFKEEDDNVSPSFFVEGTISKHPLLDEAIDRSRSVSGSTTGFNTDFEATIEVISEDKVLRVLNFKDCRVDSAKVATQTDKEEGFTGKSGFAYVEQIGVECIGLSTTNSSYDSNQKSTPRNSLMTNTLHFHEFPLGTGPQAVTTFTYDNGIEVISFPLFDQEKVLVKSNPRFTLAGLVDDTPMLYKHVDDSLALTSSTGSTNFLEDFDIDVDLYSGDSPIRGFNYVDCRVVDYVVETKTNKEETYFKTFALSNSITFECQGYHPNNPVYDLMFTFEKAGTPSSKDLRNTSTWSPEFVVKK